METQHSQKQINKIMGKKHMHSYRRTFLKMNIYYKYFSSLYILTTLLMLNVVLTRIHKQTPTHD